MMRLSDLTRATDRFLQSIRLGASGNAVSKNTFILFLVLIFPCPSALGVERIDDDLFSLSLEELMSIEVVSKKSERITQTPAIASSYSAEKLHDLGLRTLKDMLDFIPGIEINESLNSGSLVSIRGVPADSNQKVLFCWMVLLIGG